MAFADVTYLWRADLHRYGEGTGLCATAKALLLKPGYRYTFVMRLCTWLRREGAGPGWRLLALPSRLWLRRLRDRLGIDVPATANVGSGLYINHPGGIVVHPLTVIGRNCNLSHGVTLGQGNRGPRQGYPRIGNDVYLGPGAKIVGSVTIGDHAAVGANCVVTKDVPASAVVVGVPGRVISMDGSAEYVNRTDYADRGSGQEI